MTAKYPEIPYECGAGWEDLVDDTLDRVFDTDPDVEILQVKEKFGTLRIYYQTVSEHGTPTAMLIGTMIRDAEKRSQTICEVCGLPGRLMARNHWYFVACSKHDRDGTPVEVND